MGLLDLFITDDKDKKDEEDKLKDEFIEKEEQEDYNFEDTILEAINLGNDTDTVGAITGSMAGIIYGIDFIPKEWLDTLIKKDYIIDLCKKFEGIIKN